MVVWQNLKKKEEIKEGTTNIQKSSLPKLKIVVMNEEEEEENSIWDLDNQEINKP